MKFLESIVFVCMGFASSVVCATSLEEGVLDRIIQLRLKQEQEENVVRVIQPMGIPQQDVCSPSQQTRSRLAFAGKGSKNIGSAGNVTIQAGHDDVKIDNNSGTINNGVNVQIVNPNEKRCL